MVLASTLELMLGGTLLTIRGCYMGSGGSTWPGSDWGLMNFFMRCFHRQNTHPLTGSRREGTADTALGGYVRFHKAVLMFVTNREGTGAGDMVLKLQDSRHSPFFVGKSSLR